MTPARPGHSTDVWIYKKKKERKVFKVEACLKYFITVHQYCQKSDLTILD